MTKCTYRHGISSSLTRRLAELRVALPMQQHCWRGKCRVQKRNDGRIRSQRTDDIGTCIRAMRLCASQAAAVSFPGSPRPTPPLCNCSPRIPPCVAATRLDSVNTSRRLLSNFLFGHAAGEMFKRRPILRSRCNTHCVYLKQEETTLHEFLLRNLL